MKNKLQMPLFLIPVIIIVGMLGLYIYCSIISSMKFSYTFTPDNYGEYQDGITAYYEVPANKTWSNGIDVSAFSVGSQYDFYIENTCSHNLNNVTGSVMMNDGEMDSHWNFKGKFKDGVISYSYYANQSKNILMDKKESFGVTFNSRELVVPEYIIVEGNFHNNINDFTLFYVLVLLAIVWLGFLVAYILFRFDRMKLIEREVESSRIITGLASMYENVLILNMDSDTLVPYSARVSQNSGVSLEKYFVKDRGYNENLSAYIESCEFPEDNVYLEKFKSLEVLKKTLIREKCITQRYGRKTGLETEYLEAVFVLLEGDNKCAIMVRNVDEETRKEMSYKKKLKEAAEEANRANKAKTDFLSRVSHEIRTPMNAIIGLSDIIASGELDSQQREYIQVINESGKALLTMINDILDLTKIEAGKMELNEAEYDPFALLHNIKILLETRVLDKSISIITDLDSKLPGKLYGDELKLRQVIINLANNAIKFTKNGHVKIELKVESISEDKVDIRVAVSDTGIGIKEEDLDKLFGMFTQVDTKKNREIEGTGLGLSISKQMVELLGGHILVKSTYGQGSEFSFVIQQQIPSETEEEKETEEISYPNAKLLVVDDNKINLVVARTMLKSLGAEVLTARSGAEAIEILKRDADINITFMDFLMPEMDGTETTVLIRETDEISKDMVIVGLSADYSQEALDKAKNSGMNDFLEKPMERERVIGILNKWL